MKEKTNKLLTWALLGLAVLAAVFTIVFALDIDKYAGLYDVAYWMLIIMVLVSICAIVVFGLKKLFGRFATQKGYLKKFLLVCAAVAVAVVAALLLSSGSDVSNVLLEKNNLTTGTSKWIGAACILVYILVIAAACSIVYVEVAKLAKKK
ncbi:MAG: hypothetical protein AUK63_774 [bacterium P3]|nr:MAG: hypothetical protein AUK63_774 [bacterium P3]KWW41842.1 MAG: hypothetical protein F083_770 [bacterium F083]